jgi:pimeloyl-ACP methyl ester carboxylesterase
MMGAGDYVATPQLKKIFVNVIKEDLSPYFGKIHIPTLIIWGENDDVTPVSYGITMQKNIKNSSIKILENAGHFCFLDHPDNFLKAIINFIKI